MPLLPVQKIPVVLPPGYCPSDYQQFNTDIMAAEMWVDLGQVATVITSPTPPDETQGTNSSALWIKLDGNGAPVRGYKWSTTINGGAWISPYRVPQSSKELRMWEGTPEELLVYDGGEDATVGPGTGPFWEIAAEMTGRSPIGVNSDTLEGSPPVEDSLESVSLGQDIGANDYLLSAQNLPQHVHGIGEHANPTGESLYYVYAPFDPISTQTLYGVASISSNNFYAVDALGGTTTTYAIANVKLFTMDSVAADVAGAPTARVVTPLTVVPPSRGVYFIRRTARQYYAENS